MTSQVNKLGRRRITVRKAKDPGFYEVVGGGKTEKVASKPRADEIAEARQRLRAKGRR